MTGSGFEKEKGHICPEGKCDGSGWVAVIGIDTNTREKRHYGFTQCSACSAEDGRKELRDRLREIDAESGAHKFVENRRRWRLGLVGRLFPRLLHKSL